MSKKILTPKQRHFINEYLQCRNATKAAKNAGYSAKTAGPAGCRLLKNVNISEAVEKGLREQLERADITSDHILLTLKRIAFDEYGNGGKMKALELLGKSLGIFQQEPKSKPSNKSYALSAPNHQKLEREPSLLDLIPLNVK